MERNLLNISLSQGSSSAWEFLATSGILPLRCCKLDSSVSDESLERSTFRAQRRDAYGSTSCTRHPAPGQGVGRGDTMGLLRLAVLGPPEVVHDGRRLTFGLRKAEALLLYLAVEGGMHPRSKLAAFLWPDSAPHAARTPLRNALVLLRRLLANPDASASPHSHLLAEQDLLGLNPQAPVELDLEVVQRAYTEAQRHSTFPSQEPRAALVTQVQQALALVRGPFLEGFWLREETGFDQWVQQQQQWQVRLHLLFERLSAFQETGGELEQARVTLLRWLGLDPLSEEAYRRLMRVDLAL